MKIYLILSYNKSVTGDMWADVQAFTSPNVRNEVFSEVSKNHQDSETLDVEVIKRAYNKQHPQVSQSLEAPVHE